nr:hypothetical protein HmN_000159300 [Hymenolepis microstoma]
MKSTCISTHLHFASPKFPFYSIYRFASRATEHYTMDMRVSVIILSSDSNMDLIFDCEHLIVNISDGRNNSAGVQAQMKERQHTVSV